MDAEPVLLVHDGQPQPGEGDAFLHQGMRADDQRRALGDRFQRGLPRLARHLAAQPHRGHAERLEPLAEAAEVLFGQQLRGRHDGRLPAVADGARGRHRRDDGLARAHVALHQAQHRVRAGHVALDFADDALLRARQAEGQSLQQIALERRRVGQDRRRELALAPMQLLHPEVVRQQFLERQPLLRRMAAFDQGRDIGAGRRAVDVFQRLGQRRQAQVASQVIRQQFLQLETAIAHPAERLVGKRNPAGLAEPLDSGIDGRQPVRQRLVRFTQNALVAGMDHFQALVAGADLAVAPELSAPRKLLLLGGAEVKEPQGHMAGSVRHDDDQHRTATAHDRGMLDLPLNLRPRPRVEPADGMDPGPVLVAQGQVEQQVLDGMDAELVQ